MNTLFQARSSNRNMKPIDLSLGTVKKKKYYKTKERSKWGNKRKLSNEDVLDIVERLKNKETLISIANRYSVSCSSIHNIKIGNNYAWLTGLDKFIWR